MKPIKHTEAFVKRARLQITTDPQMDKRVMEDAFEAMQKGTGASTSSTAWMWPQSRVIRLAAAAMILVAIGLLAIYFSQPKPVPSGPVQVATSSADMMSVMSLNMAYRRGGIEAVDDLADMAFALPESKPSRLSVRELLTESNGV